MEYGSPEYENPMGSIGHAGSHSFCIGWRAAGYRPQLCVGSYKAFGPCPLLITWTALTYTDVNHSLH